MTDQPGVQESELLETSLTRRRFLRNSAGAGATLAAGGLLAACGSSSKTTSAATTSSSAPVSSAVGSELQSIIGKPQNLLTKGPGTIKVGAQLPLTGQGAGYGKLQGDGWRFGLQHIEAWSGGKLSLDTTYYDNQSGVPAAESAAGRQAGLSNVPFLLSSYIFGFGAVFPYIKQYKMFSPDPGGGAGPIPGPFAGAPYAYGFRAPYPTGMMDGIVKYLKQKEPTKTKWATVQPVIAPPYNNAVLAYEKQLFAQYGIDHVGEVLAPLGATNYASSIEKIKSLNPDVVLWSTFGTDLGYQAKQMVSAGVNVINAAVDFIPNVVALAGPAYKGWYFGLDYLNYLNPPSAFGKFFLAQWKSSHAGALPAYYNAGDYVTAIATAILIDRIIGFGGSVHNGDNYVKALEMDPVFPHVYGGSASANGKLVINTTTHSADSIPCLLFQGKGTGNVADITPLATYNLKGADFKTI
jgi:branched-chain amino acid transport system substrate-binding protein